MSFVPVQGECYEPSAKKRKRGPLTIDIFAGAGGMTEGAELGGASVAWAINHWDLAINTHYENHPDVVHCCEDAFMYDWRDAPLPRIIMASPSCQGHSSAATAGLEKGRRGTAPGHDRLRATASAVPRCLEIMAYRAAGQREPAPVLIVENVPDFLKWHGYRGWKAYVEDIPPGYSISENILNASDYGVPQDRKRVFVIATPSKSPFVLKPPAEREPVPFRTCISRKRDLEWTPVSQWPNLNVAAKAKSKGAMFVSKMGYSTKPDVWAWHNSTDTLPTHPDGQIRTITYKSGGQWYMVRSTSRGEEMRSFTVGEFRAAMGFNDSYKLPDSVGKAVELLGNAVCPPVAEDIVRQVIKRAL